MLPGQKGWGGGGDRQPGGKSETITVLGAFCAVYSSHHPVIHPAEKAKFTATNTARIFTGPLSRTATCTLRATHISPLRTRLTPSSTNHIELLQRRLLSSQRSYRTFCEHPILAVSRSELFNAAAQDRSSRCTGSQAVTSAPTTSSANTMTSPPRARSAEAHSCTTTRRVSSDFSSSPYTIRSETKLRRAYCTPSWSITDGSACLQCHARKRFAGRGHCLVQSHLPFCLASLPLTMFF